MIITAKKLSDLRFAAHKLIDFANGERVFLFDGEMGAGKTTFIKEVCCFLGSNDNPSSPTYSIVNEYVYPEGKIYHFDFFRIKSESEAYDLGFEEYLTSGEYCFIEWPERIENLWPDRFVKVSITLDTDDARLIDVTLAKD